MTQAELAKHYLKYWDGKEPVSNASRDLWKWFHSLDAHAIDHFMAVQALEAIATGKPAEDPQLDDALRWLAEAEEHWPKADDLLAVPSKAPRKLEALVIKTYKQALNEVVDSCHKFLTQVLNRE